MDQGYADGVGEARHRLGDVGLFRRVLRRTEEGWEERVGPGHSAGVGVEDAVISFGRGHYRGRATLSAPRQRPKVGGLKPHGLRRSTPSPFHALQHRRR